MTRASLVSLLLCGCSGGTQVDVELHSNSSATVETLTVVARSGATTLGISTFPADGGTGVALPATLRLLIDAPSLEVEATAFEADGHTRHGVNRLASLRATEQLLVDLSERGWCPAPGAAAGELVLYGDRLADGVYVFGYSGTPPPATAEACTGTEAYEYSTTHQFDGIGFAFPLGLPRRISLRAWVSQPSTWHLGLARNNTSTGYWFQPQGLCGDFDTCAQPLTSEWRRLSYEVPTGLQQTDKLLFQIFTPSGSDTVQLRVDDVRIFF